MYLYEGVVIVGECILMREQLLWENVSSCEGVVIVEVCISMRE
jgi:hypothetical protein